MITPDDLAGAFARNLSIIKAQTKGLTHADSLIQPPVRGNCMNWVLGHILENRNLVLQRLGRPSILSEAQAKRYGYGSEPVCADGEDIIPLETMLQLLEQSQGGIAEALERITPEELAQKVESFLGSTTLGQFLFFLYFHETYHLGQTELLRQLAGVDDKVL
ncbi:MAG: DinB family protein [Chloroflexi bacterium]|nr:DinB family protein [Chloroflexota bacterium]